MSTSATAPKKRALHPVDEVLAPQKLAVYGLQHVMAFYAGAVIVPILLAGAIGLSDEELVQSLSELEAMTTAAGGATDAEFEDVATPPRRRQLTRPQ